MREFLDLVHTSLVHAGIGLLWMRVAESDLFDKRVKNSTMYSPALRLWRMCARLPAAGCRLFTERSC